MGEPTQENLPSTPPSPMIISPKTDTGLGHTYLRTPDRNKVYDRVNPNVGIFDEQVLALVFRRLNWDPQTLCSASCTSRRMRAVAERILFFELCLSRAPRLVSSLVVVPNGSQPSGVVGSSPRIPGGWGAVAKLLLFCCGCVPSKFFSLPDVTKGHFTPVSRFSKTSGKSFLVRRCWGDKLYVSDPCEHASPAGEDEDLGVYRGVFGGFMQSRTRACLIGKNVQLEVRIRCPYCGARVWSMTAAGLVPKSASRRLGTHEDSLEYFVCVNGHLHGSCWLARLSDEGSDGDSDHGDDDHAGDETVAW
ncbi:EID1-like F-box protein 3 [Rhynchospora pubera]|uniref:EID1-like F-box protein 3 n=1 Tax=Rhynchospora pubera TaxID=906938 RepID=A0AAV8DSS2_9POAL|nr:EID1-like F-box protein 3 [Rhynchospora pubera]